MGTTVRFQEELLARVKGEAERRGLTLNALLTVAVLEWLEKHPLGPLVAASGAQVRIKGPTRPGGALPRSRSGKKAKKKHGRR